MVERDQRGGILGSCFHGSFILWENTQILEQEGNVTSRKELVIKLCMS